MKKATLFSFILGTLVVSFLLALGTCSTPTEMWAVSDIQQSDPVSKKVFRFHLLKEPYSIDPAKSRGSAGSYLFHNLYRSLYRHDTKKGLIPEMAKSCEYIGPLLHCHLKENIKFSNGMPIESKHFIYAFHRLIHPDTKTVQTELLLTLKNAKKILRGQLPPEKLGISAPSKYELIFEFDQYDYEFKYKLIAPALSPILSSQVRSRKHAQDQPFNGPYMITRWIPGKRIQLKPNPYYPEFELRPDVEILFIEDDMTAVRLYETGYLSFLRRIPTTEIPSFKNRSDFFQVPMARFDYIGFGPQLKNEKNLRGALAQSLNYEQLKDLLLALGRPGCPSLPPVFMSKVPCHEFNLENAKNLIANSKFESSFQKLQIHYSRMGGDDHRRVMEWLQNQWKENLKLNVEIRPNEQGMYLNRLRKDPPPIFRKGVAIDRPTCLAGLEVFVSQHRENYPQLSDLKYEKLIKKLSLTRDSEERKNLCSQAIQLLIDEHWVIPMGLIHFTMMARPYFEGWAVNNLNQLDLTDLRQKTTKSIKN